MIGENILRDKLRKIEALYAGAGTSGEKSAAAAAADRIRERLKDIGREEQIIEMQFSIHDPWSRQMFTALCRRYDLRPFRYKRMKRQTIVVKAPRTFMEKILWPQFVEIDNALSAYLSEITDKVIREEVYADTTDVEEVGQEQKRLR